MLRDKEDDRGLFFCFDLPILNLGLRGGLRCRLPHFVGHRVATSQVILCLPFLLHHKVCWYYRIELNDYVIFSALSTGTLTKANDILVTCRSTSLLDHVLLLPVDWYPGCSARKKIITNHDKLPRNTALSL